MGFCSRKKRRLEKTVKYALQLLNLFRGRYANSDPYSQCTATVKGKRCNLGEGEGLQVPCTATVKGKGCNLGEGLQVQCSLNVVGQTKYVKILRQELMKIKEIWLYICTLYCILKYNI